MVECPFVSQNFTCRETCPVWDKEGNCCSVLSIAISLRRLTILKGYKPPEDKDQIDWKKSQLFE
jgi:hypothetical protein